MKIELKTILVPTDFSQASEVALRYGKAFAEAFGASLHLLHVVEEPLVPAWTSEGYIPALEGVRQELERRAREKLEQLLQPDERQQYQVQLALRTGSPFVEIIRYARDQQIDLIVMGTHGRGPIAHMLLGSVAERVVRKAPCPVLTVRHPEHEFVLP
jgi:nucleotide-binding universal stress UspA family protein